MHHALTTRFSWLLLLIGAGTVAHAAPGPEDYCGKELPWTADRLQTDRITREDGKIQVLLRDAQGNVLARSVATDRRNPGHAVGIQLLWISKLQEAWDAHMGETPVRMKIYCDRDHLVPRDGLVVIKGAIPSGPNSKPPKVRRQAKR
jgi:hypothetical protein